MCVISYKDGKIFLLTSSGCFIQIKLHCGYILIYHRKPSAAVLDNV